MIQRPMLNVSSTDDYVTVLSIPDSPTNSMYLNSVNYNNIPPPLHSGDSTASTSTQPSNTVSSDSFDGRLKSHSMDFRSSPSSPHGRKVAAAQGLVKVMNFGADPDINHDEKPSKSSLIQPNSPPKPRRRIEFDETIRPKTHYGAISQSQSESSGLSALKRDKAHKSGFFYGLEPENDEEIEEVEGAKVQKIVLSKDTMGLRTGLSVTGVPQPDSPEKLMAIEVIDIEEGSRIAIDDQLRIEDRITKINGRPVYQMSLSRARIYLHELESQEEPSISFYRPAKPTDSERETPLQYKKISVPQQKGNTSQVHEKIELTVVKSPTGFGFGIASRTSPTDNSNIFLITTVVPDGPADGTLMPGDRIMKINDEELADKSQPEVVQIMRDCTVHSELKFEISRNTENSDTESIGSVKEETKIEIQGLDDNLEILDLKIAVNEKVGAGLGLTIKAKQTRKGNGEVVEGGVFVGRILHGSATFKDGRLKEGDRILGIETVNLLCFKRNSDAVCAFNHTISQMPASTLYFRLLIGREVEGNSEFPGRISREEFLEWAKEAEDSAKLRKLGLAASPSSSSTTGRSSSTNFLSQNQKSATSPPSTSHSNNINRSEEILDKLKENKQGSMDEDAASLISVVPEDAFDRNAAYRKSFSEKAPFGMKSPNDFESFKKIAHHRQISAPLAKPVTTPTERPSMNSLKRGGSTISRQRRRMIKSEYWNEENTPEAPKTAPTTPQLLRKKSSNFWGIFKKSPKLEKKEIKLELKSELPSPKSDKENEEDGNERQSHRSVSEGPSTSTVPRLRSKSHHDRLEKAEDLKEKEKKRKSVFKFLQSKAEPQQSVDEISPRRVLFDQNDENLGQNSLPHHYHQRFASAQEHWMGNAPNKPSAFVRYQTERLSMDPHSSARPDPILHSKSAVMWPQPPQATGYRHSQRFWLVDPHAHYAYFTRHPVYESDLAESQRNPRPTPSAGDQPLDRNANCSCPDPHRALLTSENGPAIAGRPGEEQGPRNGSRIGPDGRSGVLRKEEATSDVHLQQYPGFARNGSNRVPTKPPGYAELYPERVRAPQSDYYHQFNQYFSHTNPTPAPTSPLQKRGDQPRSTSMPREASRITAPSPAATIQPLYEGARPVYYPAHYHQQGSPSNFYQQYRSHQFHPHPATLHSTRRAAPISYDAYVERF